MLPYNVGIVEYAPGKFQPQLALNGYKRDGQGLITAHNLLFPTGVGNTDDNEYIISAVLGTNASPVQGDPAIGFVGTILNYQRPTDYQGVLMYNSTFRGRGKRVPLCNLQFDSSTTGTRSSTAYDDGTESIGSTSGGVGILQVYTPTGTQATGTLTLSGQPSDGDSFTIGIPAGTNFVYTFKTSLTPTAGQVLIGANTAATATNLFKALSGSPIGIGTNYAAGTSSLPTTATAGFPGTVIVSVPSGSNVITLTAVDSGTGPNSWTLAKSGLNLAVSAATFAGGIAGETLTAILQTATTSGGSYTTKITWTLDGTKRRAERVEIPIGTTIDQFVKVTFTMSGSTMTMGANVIFGRYFSV